MMRSGEAADFEYKLEGDVHSLYGVESMEKASKQYLSAYISSLSARLNQLTQELTTLQRTYSENWPATIQKRKEIDLLRAQLKREKAVIPIQVNVTLKLERFE